ncbi:SGNH/GDSL hydrolase family protein [Enterococcus innesii]|uniref:SGNH/GDSL hydrolase family protein n=1 Tax=Enterococcus innesii TaxID=2839759 RepID=UPI002330A8DF|nr:SGNH/GDSL hydrolase family protein [Enterococcus innesii]MDC0752947.1 SGNH/GDSL hydrolase family protein [Enterococcus innesii]MDC0777036.1 SGNH/GDSL hydrolase family protein [Enterococcus innesii]MDC0780145.1 SGNH/GDSL hydrolase family protein [Enterococcus innesii]MDC0783780.1 SGNH/GDSL hydrolase family protein [Enterococcus innesii]
MKWKKIVTYLLVVGLIAIGSGFLFHFAVPKAQPLLTPVNKLAANDSKKSAIEYLALGDSLTEGVGDETARGGFVPILAGDLEDRYDLNNLVTKNYGVAGERSDQILKRVKNDEDLRQDLSQADLITLTVGGNDVLKVIQSNFFGLSIETFTEPMEDYKERLKDLFAQIRDLNSDAPIYVLGIYNPFYLNFPEITDMQTIIDNWNKQTETFVNQQEKAFFIPINDLLYKGLSDEVGIADTEGGESEGTAESSDSESLSDSSTTASDETQSSPSTTTDSSQAVGNNITNNVLYEGDRFHPNNLGYQLMANAVRDEVIKTQNYWLLEEDTK